MTFDLFEYELKYKNDAHIMTLIDEFKNLEEELKGETEMREHAEGAADNDLKAALEKLREIKELAS